jgi:Flp pilus assembly pilin Flp
MAGLDLLTTFRTIAQAAGLRGQRGQGLVEYSLIIALISIALVAVLMSVTGELGTVFGEAVSAIDAVVP